MLAVAADRHDFVGRCVAHVDQQSSGGLEGKPDAGDPAKDGLLDRVDQGGSPGADTAGPAVAERHQLLLSYAAPGVAEADSGRSEGFGGPDGLHQVQNRSQSIS